MTPPEPDTEEAFQDALIEEALGAYRDLVPPEILAVMREEMRLALREHPMAQRVARRAAPRHVPERSGDAAAPHAAPVPSQTPETRSGGRKR